ncbi:MAG: prenyltransferase, partial [Clostridium sp.]|nr:prenyltransferase [Clostridium sp.]
MKNYLKLMRVHHYLKNVLIFLPLVFSQNLFNIDLLSK